MYLSPEYSVWAGMKKRCQNPNNKKYHLYGARGITVCKRWINFKNFYKDMGPRPSSKYTLERINGEKGYMPSNCKWATSSEQNFNRRPYRQTGKTKNRTGEKYISYSAKHLFFIVQVSGMHLKDKKLYLGVFKALPLAKKARDKYLKENKG